MRIGLPRQYARAAAGLATAGVLVGSPAAAADAAYYDRAFMLSAHERCGLFEPPVAAALHASTLQARGAAARAGRGESELGATERRARSRADRTACADPELIMVRDRVSDAFAGWSRTTRMTFPGVRSGWEADRSVYASPAWRLSQTSATGASPVIFGLAADRNGDQVLKAVVSFVGRPRPYAARIVMRDPAKAARPWLPAPGRAVLPPPPTQRAFLAAASGAAAPGLRPEARGDGQSWRFPAAAGEALAQLDPREPFVVEFLFGDDSVARATFEAGDFAAARAFVAMGAP